MASDQEVPEENLAGAIERVRRDTEFMERLAQHVERDREILDRLAGDDHRKSVAGAAERVCVAHEDALRGLGDS